MRTKLFAAAAFLIFGLTPLPAAAKCDGCVVAAVQQAQLAITQAISASTASITASVTTNVTGLINALRGSTQSITSQQAKSAEMVAESNQRTQTAMESERQDARYLVPDACAVVAPARGLQEATRNALAVGGGVGRGGGGGPRAATGGVNIDMQRALDISSGRVAAPAPEQQASLAANGACGSFVSGGVRGSTCQLAGFSPSARNGHPDADIRAETLFDGPQRAETATGFKRKLTVDPDGSERQAVEAYLRNLNTPIDLAQLTKAELARPAGRQYIAYRDAYEARMALAEKPAKVLAQNRTASATLLPVVKQLLASEVTGQFAKEYLDRAYPSWPTRGVSVDEMINLEAERRYLNKDWHAKMASLPPEAHVKEQTTMLALQVLLTARLYEKLDTLGVVTGQGVATQVRQEMVPQLITLHGQASR